MLQTKAEFFNIAKKKRRQICLGIYQIVYFFAFISDSYFSRYFSAFQLEFQVFGIIIFHFLRKVFSGNFCMVTNCWIALETVSRWQRWPPLRGPRYKEIFGRNRFRRFDLYSKYPIMVHQGKMMVNVVGIPCKTPMLISFEGPIDISKYFKVTTSVGRANQ